MEFKASDIAHLVKGELIGDPHIQISGFNGIGEASNGDLTFIDDLKYLEQLKNTKASLVLISESISASGEIPNTVCYIQVSNPRMALTTLLWHYKNLSEQKSGISKGAIIHESATIGSDVYIGHVSVGTDTSIGNHSKIYDGASIDNSVTIGDRCVIHQGARILQGSIIGNDCTIQANAIIGSDGFGFVPNSENNYIKIPHIGNVVLEDHVEIGANTTIDKGTMGSTIIRKGVKLDNLIQVAHNVEIGENTVIAAQTGIAGSTKIGKNCMIGGQVGIVGHLEIANEVKIAAQSGIGHSIKEEGAIYQGSPAFKIRDYKMAYVGFRKLPQLMKQLDFLQKEINELKSK